MKVQSAILNSSVFLAFFIGGCACDRVPEQARTTPKQPAVQSGAAAQQMVASQALETPQFPNAPDSRPVDYQLDGPGTPYIPPEQSAPPLPQRYGSANTPVKGVANRPMQRELSESNPPIIKGRRHLRRDGETYSFVEENPNLKPGSKIARSASDIMGPS